MRVGSPTPSAWGGSASGTFPAGTVVDVDWRVNCPRFYSFDHWESNNDDLDGQGNHGGHSGDFTIIENTTATAVFVPYCPGQIVIDMYSNEDILGSDDLQCSPAPGCQDLVTDEVGCYDDLLYVNPGNFSYAELSCNHGELEDDHPHWQWDGGVSDLFQGVRDTYGSAIPVSSAYRCPRKNTDEGSKSTSKHAYGEAFDWAGLSAAAMWNIAVAAETSGVSDERIFLYGGGTSKSFKTLKAAGNSGTNLPSGWTTYTNGHADGG